MYLQQEMEVLRCDVQALRRRFGTPKDDQTSTNATSGSVGPGPDPLNDGCTNHTVEVPREATPAPSDDGFTRVRGGALPTPVRRRLHVTTTNSFSVLNSLQEEDVAEIRLVGDSIVRGQLTEFCGRAPASRKRYCFPGARVEDMTESIEDYTYGATRDTRYIMHIGTNNVLATRSEELLKRYRLLLKKLKTKSSDIILSGILPRNRAGTYFYGKASYINNCLRVMCEEEGVSFVNFWDDFYGQRDLFLQDGIHLNGVGAARFGRLLNNASKFFH